jgi:hypothetical protein
MPVFRVFLRDAGVIVGLDDFQTSDEGAARSIADALYDSCSDRCSGYELWEGTALLADYAEPAPRPKLGALRDRHQCIVLEMEEAIQRSQWAIASSARLLQQLAAMKTLCAAEKALDA